MKNTAAILCASSALLFVAAPAWCAIVTVGPGGTLNGYQYGQISDAIAAAGAGDTINAAGRSVYGDNFRYDAFNLESGPAGLDLVWGNSPGVIEIGGNLGLGANSRMVFELTGTNNSRALTTGRVDYDTVLVYGNLSLNGLFEVSLGSTFVPSVGNRFELASTTGTISWTGTLGLHLSLPTLTAGQSWSTTVEAGGLLGGQSLFITVVPAPGVTALLATAALIGNGRRRR